MSFCTQCGHKSSDDAAFCEQCGKSLGKASQRPGEVSSVAKPLSSLSPNDRPARSSSRPSIKVIALALVMITAVIAVGAGVMSLFSASGNNPLIGKWRGVPPLESLEYEFTADTMLGETGEVKVRYEIRDKDVVVYPEGKTSGLVFRVVDRNNVRQEGILPLERVNTLSSEFRNRLSAVPPRDSPM